MNQRNAGLISEPLFVGATRPSMCWGVSYPALLCNMVMTMETFLMTKNLFGLLLCVPVHGVCVLLCANDPRCFDLLALWMRTRLPAWLGNRRYWRSSSYSALTLDLPGRKAQRRLRVEMAPC